MYVVYEVLQGKPRNPVGYTYAFLCFIFMTWVIVNKLHTYVHCHTYVFSVCFILYDLRHS